MSDWMKYLPSFPELRVAAIAYWRYAAAVAGGLFVVIAIATFMLPRTYFSEAKLFVRAGWETHTLDATASTGQTVSFFESRENEINSILEVFRSRGVTSTVVDVLGVDAILHGGPIPEISAEKITLKSLESVADRDSQREQAILHLEKQMQIWSPKRSNTIFMRCEANTPQLAQAINNAYLAAYQHVHANVNRTAGSYAFFVEQDQLLRDKWQTATTQLRDEKDRLGVATLGGKRTMLEAQLSDIEQKLLATEADKATTIGRIESLRKQMVNTPKFTETLRAENANAAADTMRGNLYQLQVKEKEYQARYTDQHPLVQDLREQIAALQTLLNEEGRMRTQTTSALNPAWTQLESTLLSETSALDAFVARREGLNKQHAALMEQLRQLNHDEIRINELQQAVDVAQRSCAETSQRMEQARLQHKLAEERISNVNVFQGASFVSKPIAPKRSMILALGAFVAVFCGLATIVGISCLGERSFRSLEQLSQRLRLPIVTTLSLPTLRPAV